MESASATQSAPPASGNGASAEGTSIEVHRPVDGSTIRSIPVDSPQRVAEVVGRVRAAQAEWESIGFTGRRRWLERLRDWMIDNEPRLADVMQEETGKVRAEAEAEAPFLSGTINYYGEHGKEFLAEETPTPHILPLKVKRLRIVYRPYPVVGVISPWNFPLILAFDDAIPALLAGCAVVIKPSEFTPLSTMEMVRGWKEEIGGPDVLDVVNGIGETGGALVDEVDFVQFTGSDRTGKVVMKRAADTLTPVSLELGGKDPLIVLRDADLDRAVNATATGGLANTGQICMSIERVYVEQPIYDEFVGRLSEQVRKLRQGRDERSYDADVGAMTTPAQAQIVADHVDDARSKGARVLTGGNRKEGPGDWYEPTVIADADHSMKVMTDETFGPVIPVMKVQDADEAVRMANDSRYGLSASVFAGTSSDGEAIARRIEAGAVNVNDVLTTYFAMGVPMGGWKDSGIGFRHASYGIKKFVRPESIVAPRMKQGKRDPLWFPYTSARRKLINRANRFINARGLRNRLGL
ncbi:MAG TPA: aldehyde dehydrogenase family protein [Solirubrobacterales bacterium]|nr:aldehyde dehydrogenase family protein [Solirubrobacterales bacterium]